MLTYAVVALLLLRKRLGGKINRNRGFKHRRSHSRRRGQIYYTTLISTLFIKPKPTNLTKPTFQKTFYDLETLYDSWYENESPETS